LIHGLKNPLAGLQSFVTAHSSQENGKAADWEQAVASTRRMQDMISQVVSVLREEETGTRYEISLAEIGELVAARVRPVERETGVRFIQQIHAAGVLPNRVANLVALILVNLVQNALQATPAGKTVRLGVTRAGDGVLFEVADEGPGFPAGQTAFTACRSEKSGGSGIGLALSKQLANHLGAALELKQSTPSGCVFALSLPARLGAEKSREETVSLAG